MDYPLRILVFEGCGANEIASDSSLHRRRSRNSTLPFGLSSNAPSAGGGRRMYRHSFSSRPRARVGTAVFACSNSPSRACRGPLVVTTGGPGPPRAVGS